MKTFRCCCTCKPKCVQNQALLLNSVICAPVESSRKLAESETMSQTGSHCLQGSE
jgi:hypothetical protein